MSEKAKNKRKSKIKINFSDVTTNGFSFKFNTNNVNTKPLRLLEQLYILGSDEALTRDEKDIRIKKMLESE